MCAFRLKSKRIFVTICIPMLSGREPRHFLPGVGK